MLPPRPMRPSCIQRIDVSHDGIVFYLYVNNSNLLALSACAFRSVRCFDRTATSSCRRTRKSQWFRRNGGAEACMWVRTLHPQSAQTAQAPGLVVFRHPSGILIDFAVLVSSSAAFCNSLPILE